jgi:hypothetical protein
MKIRQHDQNQARGEVDDNQSRADLRYGVYTNEWFAEYIILNLLDIINLGLFDCYDGFGTDWQADFWADFPWNGPDRLTVIRLIQADPRWPELVSGFKAEFDGWSLEAEFEAGARTLPSFAD